MKKKNKGIFSSENFEKAFARAKERAEKIKYFTKVAYFAQTDEDCIASLIEYAKEEGKKEAIEFIANEDGWEESEQFYKEKLLKKI